MLRKIYWMMMMGTLWMVSCKNECDKDIDISGSSTEVIVTRTEKELFDFKSPADAQSWLRKYPQLSNNYFQRATFPQDSLLANYLYSFYTNKELRYLYEST